MNSTPAKNASLLYLASSILACALIAINAAQGAFIYALLWCVVLAIDYQRFMSPDARAKYSSFWLGMYGALVVFNVVVTIAVVMEKGLLAAASNILCTVTAALWTLQQNALRPAKPVVESE